MTNNTVKRSNCPVCTEIAIRVQQIAQERDGYMLAALEMQDELNRLRHFKNATLRLAQDMPGRSDMALEPKERDTWHQPEKKLKSKAPFTFGGDL